MPSHRSQSEILPGAGEQLRCQVVRELIRLRSEKSTTDKESARAISLTARQGQMPFFSTAQASGRPLAVAPQTFAAILYGRLHGYSRKRSEEILAANPEAASGTIWRLAAVGQSEGCKTAEDFEQWVQRELSEAMKSPSNP